jgi:nuclear transport factor 2 (NTF2) superfamily protein
VIDAPAPKENNSMSRPPLPPFTVETAVQKVRMAEDSWNSRDPAKVAKAYTEDSRWRNRAEFLKGRDAIVSFLTRKWGSELDYRLIKELWTFRDNRIAVRFAYEWHDDSGHWFRSYGNENWEFDEHGLMRLRIASIKIFPSRRATASTIGHSAAAPIITLRWAISGCEKRWKRIVGKCAWPSLHLAIIVCWTQAETRLFRGPIIVVEFLAN